MTARPGQVKTEMKVDLPRPRHYDQVVTERFLQLKRHLLDSLREESEAAVAAPA